MDALLDATAAASVRRERPRAVAPAGVHPFRPAAKVTEVVPGAAAAES